ncbi:MAG TPA: hypothetical protein GX526_03990 [Thermoanaerobacterales bacterium]|nr:hypothetical protein [Thermoanaerobacterales bacterium]
MICRRCPSCGSGWYSANTLPWNCPVCHHVLDSRHEIPIRGERTSSAL